MERTSSALGENSLYSVKGGPSARRRGGRAAWRPVPARRDNTDHTAYEKAPDSTIRCPASQAVSSVPPPTRRSTAPPSTRWFSRATHPVSRTNTVRGHPLEGPEESRTEGVACSNHAEGTASDPRNDRIRRRLRSPSAALDIHHASSSGCRDRAEHGWLPGCRRHQEYCMCEAPSSVQRTCPRQRLTRTGRRPSAFVMREVSSPLP
jgi:hypothetical protein